MSKILRKATFAAIAVTGLAAASLVSMTAPAAARIVCDSDGDDCWHVPGYYPGYYYGPDYDRDYWRHRAWEEQRERDWYWRHRDWDRDDRAGIWFNF